MGLAKAATALAALAGLAAAAPTTPAAREVSATSRYCDAATTVCYSEYTTSNNIAYRIAIPDDAAAAPFPVLLQIVAPKATGWAGIAWGGQMANNPLTVAWPNGDAVVVSSRLASGHVLPAAYAGARYTLLPTSAANDTHWRLDVLCDGCSQWTAGGKTSALDPSSTAVPLAWAESGKAVATPASNTSSFSIHQGKGKWSHDLSSAKLAHFADLVQKLQSGS